MGHVVAVPGGDQELLVGETGLTFRHTVVLHQLTPPDQDGVARHQPGQDPLVVDGGAVLPCDSLAVHELGLEQLDNGLKFKVGKQSRIVEAVRCPLVNILISSSPECVDLNLSGLKSGLDSLFNILIVTIIVGGPVLDTLIFSLLLDGFIETVLYLLNIPLIFFQ